VSTEVLIKNNQPLPVDQKRLSKLVEKALRVEHFPKPAEVSIVLTNDSNIHELNRKYRGVDRPTDVLAFSQLEDIEILPEEVPVPLGDIVISVETAVRQAKEHCHSLEEELDLLVVHGVLHLLGYNDETEEEAEEMRNHERKILS
jgi:probable rRNA maturation factor